MSKQALAVKYRPQRFEDVVEQDVPKAILTEQLKNKTFKNCLLFCGGAGTGKAQPLYSKVLTPEGFITMGDVRVGTEVITSKGNIAKVSGVYPQGSRSVYRITLSDRTHIDVSDEHLNVVYRYDTHKKLREDFTLTTLELLELFKSSSDKLRIDIPRILNFTPSESLPVDPYLLGALIGDDSLTKGNFGFSNKEKDVLDRVSDLLLDWDLHLVPKKGSDCDYNMTYITKPNYYKLQYKDIVFDSVAELVNYLVEEGYPKFDPNTILKMCDGTCSITLGNYPELREKIKLLEHKKPSSTGLKQTLQQLGLDCKSVQKHIPHEYLLASFEDRLRLLQGLFDTDGYIDNWGNTTLSTSSPQLSEDIAFLVRSLGCRDTITCSASGYKNPEGKFVDCHDSYTHTIKVPNDMVICCSDKHLSRYKTRMYEPMHNIVSIECIGSMECQCIMVDHEDHTYISDDFIPTHNTTTARLFGKEVNNFKGHIIEIDAASHNGVEDARRIIENAKTQSLDSEYKVFLLDEVHMLSIAAWNALLKILEEPPAKSLFVFCTTDPQKIPATILSRVQRFNFQKISQKGIMDRLKFIINSENDEMSKLEEFRDSDLITYDESSIEFIAKQADGGMRDAITLLDKCISYNTNLTLPNVLEALGSVNYDTMFELTEALNKMEGKVVLEKIEFIHTSGLDLKQFMKQYSYFVLDLCKYEYFHNFEHLQMPSTYEDKMKSFTEEDFAFFRQLLDVVLRLNKDIQWETTPKPVIESQLLLLCMED